MVRTVNSAISRRIVGRHVVSRRCSVVARATPSFSAEEEANPSAHDMVSGEWPMTLSLASYDSVKEHIKGRICEDSANQFASAVMKTGVDGYVCQASDSFATIQELRLDEDVSEVYVVNRQRQLVGVVPADTQAEEGAVVADVMEPPRIMFPVHKRLYHAAGVMLKHNMRTLPVVNERCKLVGVLSHDQVEEALVM